MQRVNVAPAPKRRLPEHGKATSKGGTRGCRAQTRRFAASADAASAITLAKNSFDCPSNKRSAVKDLMVATAPALAVVEGRMTDTSGRPSMNLVGSGKILLVCASSPPGLLRSGKATPLTGSTTPASGCEAALPSLSCHTERGSTLP